MNTKHNFTIRALFTFFASGKRLALSFFLFGSLALGAQQADSGTPQSIFDYLTAEEGVKITLETDLVSLVENKRSNEYRPAVLRLADGQSFPAEVKPRGKFRRKTCEMPPLKIKFSKKMLVSMGFDTLNEVKLAIPCMESEEGEQLIVKEYLAYRMFERLTAASVRARLVRLTLKDNHVERSRKQMLAILLEDEEQTVSRLHGEEIEAYGISPDSLLTNQVALVAAFQFMIGNTDWDISMQRNVRLIRAPESGKVLAVPFDFDFSGLVGAPYASPASETGLRTVRDRYLQADGISEDAMQRAFQILRSAKKDLLDTCRTKYLSRDQVSETLAYLEYFFLQIENREPYPVLIEFLE